MRNNNVMGLLFSNMHDEVLRDLTDSRALGSVPFGGRYRLIDFPLSNMVNAGISKVGIITKSNYQSLMDHIGSGKSWDLSRKNEGLYFLPPYGTSDAMYNGRISSLNSIMPFFRNSKEEYVVMSDCHVVGNIDYDRLVEEHIASGADVTVACKTGIPPVNLDNLLVWTGEEGRITDMAINRTWEKECSYGIGLYVMRKDYLVQALRTAVSRNRTSFEWDILQRHVTDHHLHCYHVPEYVSVISCMNNYFQANIALLDPVVRRELFLSSRPIYTKVRDCAPALHGIHADVSNSLIADGANIQGTVRNSIIFRDVKVDRDAVVENCVLMQGTLISEKSSLNCVVTDKNVVVKDGRTLHGFDSYPVFISKGTIV